MDQLHPLKSLLQIQLATDAQATLYLPYVLSSLKADDVEPSEHIQKWITRSSSLILSKDGGARWAGLLIALRTATLSQSLMIECAQTWVGSALPLLSKNEPAPTVKAAIRLLRRIFTGAIEIPEFQRQVSIQNVPKFSQALISLGEKSNDEELKVLCLDTLSQIVPLYPPLHRAVNIPLSTFSLRFLNGSAPRSIPSRLVFSASRLFSILHYTCGKVGAAAQWRKSVDDTIAFAWSSFMAIRTTFPTSSIPGVIPQQNGAGDDPISSIPLHLDRLRAAIVVLSDLMQTSNPRPVVLPIGPLVQLCVALLRSTADEKIEGHVDPIVRSVEVSVNPHIQKLGCDLCRALAFCARQHLTPHISQLLFYLAHQLEKPYSAQERIPFLSATTAVVQICVLPRDPLLCSRLTRAILPFISNLLATQNEVQRESVVGAGSKSRKGKKRARGYEGDEIFNVNRLVICPTTQDAEVVLSTLELLRLILRNGSLAPAVQSIATRILLAIYVTLPQIPPAQLSPDASLHGRILDVVSKTGSEFAAGTTSTMSKSLALVIGTSIHNAISSDIIRELELLLHPRVPPLVRSLPQVETLSLFQAEESQEEQDTRRTLHIGVSDEILTGAPHDSDVVHTHVQAISNSVNITSPISMKTSVLMDTTDSAPPLSTQTISSIPPAMNPPHVTPSEASQPQPVVETPVAAPKVQGPTTAIPLPATSASGTVTSMAKANSLLPPDPLLSSSTAKSGTITQAVSSSAAQVSPKSMDVDEDEDEPMPAIDIGSDSEEE